MKLYKDTKTIHVPVSIGGLVIDALALIFLVTVVIALNRTSHSNSDFLYSLFVYFVPTFLLREWIAAKTS